MLAPAAAVRPPPDMARDDPSPPHGKHRTRRKDAHLMTNNDTTPCIHPHDLPSMADGTVKQQRFAYAIRRKAVRCVNAAIEASLARDDAERVADLLTRCLCDAPQARHSLWWIDGCFGDADEFAERVIRACLAWHGDGSPAPLIDSFDDPEGLY